MFSNRDFHSITGYTLTELLVGLAIFIVILLPLMTFSSKIAFSTKSKDLQVAYTLLKGECDVIYKNHMLPEENREIKVGNIIYMVVCDYEKDSVLTSWELSVNRKKNKIAKIKGIVFTQ